MHKWGHIHMPWLSLLTTFSRKLRKSKNEFVVGGDKSVAILIKFQAYEHRPKYMLTDISHLAGYCVETFWHVLNDEMFISNGWWIDRLIQANLMKHACLQIEYLFKEKEKERVVCTVGNVICDTSMTPHISTLISTVFSLFLLFQVFFIIAKL